MKFLDIRTDYAFKKVFGSDTNKDILISFLNALIYDNKTHKIKDLTIVDPYNIPMIKGVKDTFVDVKAVLDDDSKAIIEMQVLNHAGFEKRILYNAAKNYSIQLSKSENYNLLNPVIALTIVDFIMFEDSKNIVNNFKLIEKDKLITYNDDIELIFVELPKFNKGLKDLVGIKEQWIYFLKNTENLEYIPKNLDQEILKALESANEANLTKDELEVQHKRKEFISIQKLAILKAKDDGISVGIERGIERGIEQGIEQGIERGIKQGIEQGVEQGISQGVELRNIEIAKNLLDILDDETISLKTGLKISVIKSLRT